jgi:hypothetical protein
MYTLLPDEKATTVMLYTLNAMYRGEVVTKDNAKVNTWLRTAGAPRFIHLLNCNMLVFGGGGAPRSYHYPEVFLPNQQVLAFHLAPPATDLVDYEADEKNRMMLPTVLHVGTFVFKGEVRISSNGDIGGNLEISKIPWLSFYNLEITNPCLSHMPPIHTNLALVSPERVVYGLQE